MIYDQHFEKSLNGSAVLYHYEELIIADMVPQKKFERRTDSANSRYPMQLQIPLALDSQPTWPAHESHV
jgi:hypothetical protein